MTLQEFFDHISANPAIILIFFVAIPVTAFIANLLGRGEGHLSPWKYLYSVLVYLSTIPGMFSILLCIYLFLFERQPILQTNIYTQVLPVIVMGTTLLIIKLNVPFDLIPGFDKLSALLLITFTIIGFMWILDRTHIIAITIIPFHYVLIMLGVAILIVMYGLKEIAK